MLAECWKAKGLYGMQGLQGHFSPLRVNTIGSTHNHCALSPILCLLPALLQGIRKECQAGTKGHSTSVAIPWEQELLWPGGLKV